MLDNWCLFINLLVLSYGLYSLLMWPINTRLHGALSHIFGKEIARSLFQKLHPDFTYEKYTADKHLHQIIFNSALEEFTRLCDKEKENTQPNEGIFTQRRGHE